MPMLPSIQERLPRTWSAFFARHGNLTPAQQAAIPSILSGQNTLLVAPTATGKTEAAIAPLLERHLFGAKGSARQDPELRILYICPTRALVRDLYERLVTPLTEVGVSLAMKSGDTGPVPVQRPPFVLITTPESTDSLLTRAPRFLGSVAAIVLDEIHLFDATPRGDHLRCLLKRIDHIRHYRAQAVGQEPVAPLQRVALSATVSNPAAMAQRYLVASLRDMQVEPDPIAIIQIAGGRTLAGTLQQMSNLDDLVGVLSLQMTGQSQMRKALVFCNARHEVEQVAAYLRGHLSFEAAIFVHYSNLDPALRRQVEDGLAQASTAICVCTSTLELGIDIGSIDLVVLVGPPPSPAAFMQRIGRAGRRHRKATVVGLSRSPLEEISFQALFRLAQLMEQVNTEQVNTDLATHHAFCLSVLVQQTFSILKQSPTGGIRLADLRRVVPDMLDVEGTGTEGNIRDNPVDGQALLRLLNHLAASRYLKHGRAGEWRAGPALDELADAHEIYSNIGTSLLSILVVDAYTGQALAQIERSRSQGDILLIGGRLMDVVWRAQYRIGVRAPNAPRHQGWSDAELYTHASPFAVSVEVSQTVAMLLGFSVGEVALLQTERGNWLFHFWGDIYGELLAGILRAYLTEEEGPTVVARSNEHAVLIPDGYTWLPTWEERVVRQQVYRLLPRLEPFLELGRFHALLPPDLAAQSTLAQLNLPRFERLYRSATVIRPTAGQRERLLQLLG